MRRELVPTSKRTLREGDGDAGKETNNSSERDNQEQVLADVNDGDNDNEQLAELRGFGIRRLRRR